MQQPDPRGHGIPRSARLAWSAPQQPPAVSRPERPVPASRRAVTAHWNTPSAPDASPTVGLRSELPRYRCRPGHRRAHGRAGPHSRAGRGRGRVIPGVPPDVGEGSALSDVRGLQHHGRRAVDGRQGSFVAVPARGVAQQPDGGVRRRLHADDQHPVGPPGPDRDRGLIQRIDAGGSPGGQGEVHAAEPEPDGQMCRRHVARGVGQVHRAGLADAAAVDGRHHAARRCPRGPARC